MNLTIEEMKGIVARVTYRLGWKFRVYQGETRGAMLEIYAGIPPYDSEKGFLGWLFWRLREIEIHECGEFFKVDGVCFADPHRSMSDRDLLSI